MEIILSFDKPSYCRLGRLLYPYDCMKRKLKKFNEEKLKIAKRKTDLLKKIEKLGKKKKLRFQK